MKIAISLVNCKQSSCSQKEKIGKNNNCKNLVIYSSNLGLTLANGRFPKTLQNLIFLTPNSYSVIVGKLISDGSLEKCSLNSNTRFKFKQSVERAYYVLFPLCLFLIIVLVFRI